VRDYGCRSGSGPCRTGPGGHHLGDGGNYDSVPAVSDSFGILETALNFGGVTTTNNTIVFLGTTVSGDPQSATVASTPFDVVIATVSGQSLRNDTNIATDLLFGSEIWSTSQ